MIFCLAPLHEPIEMGPKSSDRRGSRQSGIPRFWSTRVDERLCRNRIDRFAGFDKLHCQRVHHSRVKGFTVSNVVKDFTVGSSVPGRVEIAIRGDGQILADAGMDTQAAGNLAALLLKTAFHASQNMVPAPSANPTFNGEVVPLSTIGLAADPPDHHQILVLGMGAAQVGFAISNDDARAFGERLLLVSTPTNQKPN